VDVALALSALMLGLAGAPHCAVMCGAACGSVIRPGHTGTWIGFHLARLTGYAFAGAAAASSVGALSIWSQYTPALRPLWTLAHAAALMLGLWLLWRGRQPAWMENLGRSAQWAAPQAGGWQLMRGPGRAAAAGVLWVAWPCGLLQSALVIAALANTASGGALTMAAFALASAVGLAAAPWLWWRLRGTAVAGSAAAWAVRASGLLLAGASGWALGHGLWEQLANYCGF
jgi:sulfite exporter TauE/SafE